MKKSSEYEFLERHKVRHAVTLYGTLEPDLTGLGLFPCVGSRDLGGDSVVTLTPQRGLWVLWGATADLHSADLCTTNSLKKTHTGTLVALHQRPAGIFQIRALQHKSAV